MDICEVFALNIQPTQLKKILSTDKHNDKGYNEERAYFLCWLKEQFSLGIKYASQLDAWFWYTLVAVPDDDIEIPQDEPDWISGLKFALDEQINSNERNYSESRGQL